MRKAIVGTLSLWLASSGWSAAQSPPTSGLPVAPVQRPALELPPPVMPSGPGLVPPAPTIVAEPVGKPVNRTSMKLPPVAGSMSYLQAPGTAEPMAPATTPAPITTSTPMPMTTASTLSVLPPGATPMVYADEGSMLGDSFLGSPDENGRWYANFEYLLWFLKQYEPLPLVQGTPSEFTGPDTTPEVLAAVTVPLFTANRLTAGAYSGGRFTTGLFLDECGDYGFEVSALYLPKRGRDYFIYSNGTPGAISQGFADPANATGVITNLYLSFPGEYEGAIFIQGGTEMYGGEANATIHSFSLLSERFDILAGFRYLSINEEISMTRRSRFYADNSVLGGFERFAAQNDFYGGQIGGRARYRNERLVLDATLKLALGAMRMRGDISGAADSVVPGMPTVVLPGSIYAQPTNIGEYATTKTVFLPELTLNFGYEFRPGVVAFVGYNVLGVTSLFRAGGLINPNVNVNQVPFITAPADRSTLPPPTYVGARDEFWAQGINFGVSLKY